MTHKKNLKMSNNQYPSATSGKNEAGSNASKNDNKKFIYLLLIALIGSWVYFIIDKNKVKEERTVFIERISKDSLDQAVLKSQFDLLTVKADSITTNNQQLQGALVEKNNDIQKLKSSISAILSKKKVSDAELKEAKKQLAELQSKIEALYAQVETLKAENQQLTVSNDQLTNDKKQLTEEKGALETNLNKTKEEKAKVEDIASTLHASGINISAINLRGSKEKETSTAKKADYLRVSFNIDENRITPSGSKPLMVCIYYPDGTLSQSSGSFTDREGNTKQYTNKVDVNYETGKVTPVSFNWKPGNKFPIGDYKIEVYNNGFKIGEAIKSLKKSGFLGL